MSGMSNSHNPTPIQGVWIQAVPASNALPTGSVTGPKKRTQSSNKVTRKKLKPTLQDKELEDSRPKKPTRPLTAYNLFFRYERARILASLPVRTKGKPRNSHGKLGFEDMGRLIGSRWQAIDATAKAHFNGLANQEKIKHRIAMNKYDCELAIWESGEPQLSGNNTSSVAEPNETAAIAHERQHCSPLRKVWTMAELAERLGDDGVEILVNAFR